MVKDSLSSLNEETLDFINKNEDVRKSLILVGYGGSHAYGTSVEGSDVDIRGIATRTPENILLGKDFEQICSNITDTTIYSFDKMVKLLCNCNPNIIEMLGLKPEHYFYINDLGKYLLDNKSLFITKRAISSFGGYATQQLRRLENKSSGIASQSKHEANILKTIQNDKYYFEEKYKNFPNDSISLYLDEGTQGLEKEIFLDVNLKHCPLRDYTGIIDEMNAIARSYEKFGQRNKNAASHNKLGKHMMHLFRLYLMCFDILEKGEINTYREKERDFLLSIRAGKYLDDKNQPVPEFYELLDEFENHLAKLKKTSEIPENVDMKKVDKLVKTVNGNVMGVKI